MTQTISEISKRYRQTRKGILVKRYLDIKEKARKLKLEIIDRNHFMIWSIEDENFRYGYYYYYHSNFNKKFAPVIERLDKSKGFTAENLIWTIQKNKNRTNGKSIVIVDGDNITKYASARKAELELKLPRGVLSRALREGKRYKSLRVEVKSFN
jgi:hypothetical protein